MTKFRSTLGLSALLAVVILLSAAVTFAQTVTGTIAGTVKDSSGAVVPNAQIQVLNQDTGISRTLQTDATGHYAALLLPLGNYQVTATAQGFQTEVRNGIELTVGREAVVDMAMAVGAMTQKVEVTGEAAVVNTTSATVEGLVTETQIRELPLNGRSYNDLALLNPGVIYAVTNHNSSGDGFGQRMSVNGSRLNMNLFLIDGTVMNDTSQTAGTVNADSLGVEGIREFTVLTHNYPAEFGHSAGGVVNAVTRSGTNQLHGSLYEFLRNSDLDARDFFQPGSIEPFRRNQFGGSIGGKIKKDKLFYFGNYEGFRQSLAIPVAGYVPDALAHQGIIPINGQNVNIGVSPLIQPYMNLFALPNGADTGSGTGLWTYDFKQPIHENYYMERVDFHISDKDNLFVRDVYDPSNRPRQNSDPYWSVLDEATNYFGQIGETHIFSPTAINDFRAAFNRTFRDTDVGPVNPAIASLITPSLSFVPGMPLGRIQPAGGMEYEGNLNNDPSNNTQNLFEESDTFTLIRGPHSFKFGADLERYQTIQISGANIRGSWLFGGIQSWLQAQPLNIDAGKILGQNQFGFSTGEFGWRQWLPAWFVQDDWRVNSRLTLNLGLRQEFFSDPHEVNGLSATLINLTDPTSTIGVPFHTAKLNFAPRIGLAWDPTGSGKTSIRFGAGTYFNEVNLRDAAGNSGPPSDYRFAANYTVVCNWTPGAANGCANFPYMPANPPLSTAKSETPVQYHLPTPTVEQYSLTVQRQITNSTSLSVGYVGWYGYHMIAQVLVNDKLPDPATGLYTTPGAFKPNPAFGTINEGEGIAQANYNALQAEFRRRMASGWMFQLSYTYGKALGDADTTQNAETSNVGAAYVVMNPLNIDEDYGRTVMDQRHLVVFNSQYEFPFAQHLTNRFAKALLGGWFINGIWSYGSGQPLTLTDGFNRSGDGDPDFPDRPNVNPGFTNNPTSGVSGGCGGVFPAGAQLRTPNMWFNPCAFSLETPGTFGNLGRFTVNGPGIDTLNMAIARTFALTERMKLQFRAESFNLLNHPMFGTPGLALFNSSGTYAGSAPTITQTTNPGLGGRNIQFGLKMTF